MADTWTIDAIRRWTCDFFKKNNIDSPQLDADVLLADTLGVERIQLLICGDQILTQDELARFKERIVRRARQHEPVAYILGKKEFWSLELKVTRDTLIPRPDTECLVEAALQAIRAKNKLTQPRVDDGENLREYPQNQELTREILPDERLASYVELWADQDAQNDITDEDIARQQAIPEVDETGAPIASRDIYEDIEHEAPPNDQTTVSQPDTPATKDELRIVDIGTGSGAIAIALASELKNEPASITAVDISEQALAVAKENAITHGFNKIKFIQSNLLDEFNESFDLIVSNPPYVSEDEYKNVSDEVKHEPKLALTAENQGLSVYKRLVPQSFSHLSHGGTLAVEIGATQADAVSDLFKRAGFENVCIKPDYAGLPRVVLGSKP